MIFSSSVRRCFVFCLIFICAALIYSFALQSPLFFDDLPNLTENTPLHIDGMSFDTWRTAAFSSDAGPLMRPVSMLSFAANYVAFGGFTPFSLKVVNLAIHLLIAALVFRLALSIFRAPVLRHRHKNELQLVAFAAAAIWLLHPLHVSTVLYSVQRMAQLSTLFTVVGLCVFLRYRLRWAEQGASVGELLAVSLWLLLVTLFATLSKENGALLPWLLAVVEVSLFRGRWCGAQSRLVLWLGWLALLFPVLLVALIFVFDAAFFTAGYYRRSFTMVERLLTQSRVLWHYLSWLFLPDIKAMGFQHDDIMLSRGVLQPMTTLFSLLAWVLLLALAFALRRRAPLLIFALLFFFVAHAMESSILALDMVYEHRNYLPSIGLCLFFAPLLTSCTILRGRVNIWLPIGGVLGVLFVLLIARTQIWSGQLSLAKANVVNHPASSRAHYFYATALMARYIDGQKAGMPEEDSKSLMVAVRHHFLQMNREADDAVLALVMLMYVDSYYFPALGQAMAWFEQLEELPSERVLRPTDFAAISLLLDCIASGVCVVPQARAEAFVESLLSHNQGNVHLLLSQYEFLVATGAPLELRVLPLERAAIRAPSHPSVQVYRIVERAQLDDVGGMYEVLGHWLAHDPNRWALPLIMPLFATGESELESLPVKQPVLRSGT